MSVKQLNQKLRRLFSALEQGWMLPIATQNVRATGTDLVRYLAEGFGVNVFAHEGDTVYHCYASLRREVEFLMGYLPDPGPRAEGPREGDDGDAFQTWLRRHDEYDFGTGQGEP